MGFRTGAYAKIWEVTPMSDTSTKVRLSVSRKNKQTNEYEQDFSGFVLAIGTAAAKKAACLKEGERIKLGDVDVTTKYDKEKKVTYTNFKMFSFEVEGDESSSQPQTLSLRLMMAKLMTAGCHSKVIAYGRSKLRTTH